MCKRKRKIYGGLQNERPIRRAAKWLHIHHSTWCLRIISTAAVRSNLSNLFIPFCLETVSTILHYYRMRLDCVNTIYRYRYRLIIIIIIINNTLSYYIFNFPLWTLQTKRNSLHRFSIYFSVSSSKAHSKHQNRKLSFRSRCEGIKCVVTSRENWKLTTTTKRNGRNGELDANRSYLIYVRAKSESIAQAHAN